MGQATLAGNPPVTIRVRRSGRARRVSLRVSALDGRVTLSVPPGVAEAEALAFAQDKAAWIRGHLANRAETVRVGIGTEVPVAGRVLPVRAGAVRRGVLRDDAIEVPAARAMVGPRVKAALIGLARARLTEASARHAAGLDRTHGCITLRDTRSRWGSCSAAGNLMYSWRLAMAPPEVLDYVAAHEVAHLVEMNHSPAYWAVVARLMPGYAAPRRWLKTHGADLHRYRFDDRGD